MGLVVVLDTSFLIAALTEETNQNRKKAERIYDSLKVLKEEGRIERLYLLWPICYEFLSTRSVKNKTVFFRWDMFLQEFRREIFSGLNLDFEDDVRFRNKAYEKLMEEKEPPSLVDRVIGEFLIEKSRKEPQKKFLLITFDSDFFRYWLSHNILIVQTPEMLTQQC